MYINTNASNASNASNATPARCAVRVLSRPFFYSEFARCRCSRPVKNFRHFGCGVGVYEYDTEMNTAVMPRDLDCCNSQQSSRADCGSRWES